VKRLVLLLAAVVTFIPSYAGADVQRGSEGAVVTEVQTILAGFGYSVAIDGEFGPQTEKAVRLWQKSNGLTIDGIVGDETIASLRSARRIGNQMQVTPTDSPPGLNGLPFAPAGLSDCADAEFYRQQWNLPEAFTTIVYRESRCHNRESVHTFCCWSRYQHFISSHLSRQSAYRQRIITECQVSGREDIDSDTPIDKQRAACVTAVVYSISGLRPWAL
jgi:peptidoglycan hydrolase-like protein with peptidoglycan-binding domain